MSIEIGEDLWQFGCNLLRALVTRTRPDQIHCADSIKYDRFIAGRHFPPRTAFVPSRAATAGCCCCCWERENAAVSVASLMHGAGRTPLALRTQYNWLRSAPITDAAVVADVSRLGSFLPSKSSVNRACLDPSLRSVLFGFYAPHSVVDVVGLRVSFLSDVGWMWMS